MTTRIEMDSGRNHQWVPNREVEVQQRAGYLPNCKVSKSTEGK